MSQEEYENKFETKDKKSKILKAAFAQVSDIRKFEIEMYWKRATYFWALIAVAFAGYFAILGANTLENKFFLSLLISCIGLVFTFGWHLANRGSKYWQENWENHLDLLEDEVTGPLYKTLLERPDKGTLSEMLVTEPLSISVSKINQWISVFVIFIWVSLLMYSAYKSLNPLGLSNNQWWIILAHAFVIIAAVGSCILMLSKGKTHKDEHNPRLINRTTRIR